MQNAEHKAQDAERPMAQYDDVGTSTIAIAGVIGALALFLLVTLLMVFYEGAQQAQNTIKNIDQPFVERDDLLAKEQARLNNYGWLKEEKDKSGKKRQVYAIPIDRAMDLVVTELGSRGARKAAGKKAGGKSDAKP